ncbi:hypothetical protein ACFPRL_30585 [Pseudoclavibacter helvolus]
MRDRDAGVLRLWVSVEVRGELLVRLARQVGVVEGDAEASVFGGDREGGEPPVGVLFEDVEQAAEVLSLGEQRERFRHVMTPGLHEKSPAGGRGLRDETKLDGSPRPECGEVSAAPPVRAVGNSGRSQRSRIQAR